MLNLVLSSNVLVHVQTVLSLTKRDVQHVNVIHVDSDNLYINSPVGEATANAVTIEVYANSARLITLIVVRENDLVVVHRVLIQHWFSVYQQRASTISIVELDKNAVVHVFNVLMPLIIRTAFIHFVSTNCYNLLSFISFIYEE